jgi:hypothetical protein
VAPRRLSRTRPAPDPQAPRSRRRWIYAAVSAAALLAAIAIPAIPAAADNGEIDFTTVTGDGSGDLAVTVASDYPLLAGSLTVHVLDLTDFTTDLSTWAYDAPQTYTLASPSADLAGLEPGTYTVTLDATDTNSPADQVAGVGPDDDSTFAFLAQPVVTLSAPTFPTTAPAQQVSIAGTISSTCPTLACPSGGWPLDTPVTITDVTNSSQPTWSGQTSDTGGDFTVSGITGNPGDEYTASVPAQAGYSLAATSAGSIQDVAQFTIGTITAVAGTAYLGQQTITGTVTYPSPTSGFEPVPAPAGITITATASGQQPVTTQTGANGTFSLGPLPTISGSTAWTLSGPTNDLATSPFLTVEPSTVDAVQQEFPATITKFTARATMNREVYVAGCLSSPASGAPADNPGIQIQYRTSTKAVWRTLGAVSSMPVAGCAGAGFLGNGLQPAGRAYYRATFGGDSVYLAATSATSVGWLYQERYVPFSLTPTSVRAGQKITVKSRLEILGNYGTKWRAFTGQKVVIAFSKRVKNKIWYEVRSLKTNKKGDFSATFADTVGTQYWSVGYAGNATHYPQWSSNVHVKVHGQLRAATVMSPAATTSAKASSPLIPVIRPPGLPAGGLWQEFLIVAQPLIYLLAR